MIGEMPLRPWKRARWAQNPCCLGSPLPRLMAQPSLPLLSPAGGEYPERPWQGSDHPSERGPVSANLGRSRAQEQTANGQWWGGGAAKGCRLVTMRHTAASLRPVPRPLLPRAMCRAAGNRAGQGAQNQESQEDKETLVGLLGTGGGRRARGSPRLPVAARQGTLALRDWHCAPSHPTHCPLCLTPSCLAFFDPVAEGPSLIPFCVVLPADSSPRWWPRGRGSPPAPISDLCLPLQELPV